MSGLGNKAIMSENIKSYVAASQKERAEICAELNISYSTFTDWYNGNKYPRIDKIELMANYFGIQKADLIEEHGNIEDNVASTRDQKRILLLAKRLEKIPERKRERIIHNIEDTVNTYLETMEIDGEE